MRIDYQKLDRKKNEELIKIIFWLRESNEKKRNKMYVQERVIKNMLRRMDKIKKEMSYITDHKWAFGNGYIGRNHIKTKRS